MNSPSVKPTTRARWLASSVCWTLSCAAGWWLLTKAVPHWQLRDSTANMVSVGGFWVAHVLIWRRAVAGSTTYLYSLATQAAAVSAVGSVWIMLLLALQVLSLLVGVVVSALALGIFLSDCP